MANEGQSPAAKSPDRRKPIGWSLLALGLAWQAFIFYKYRNGPFVGLLEAAIDCLPLVVIALACFLLHRAYVGKVDAEEQIVSEEQAEEPEASAPAADTPKPQPSAPRRSRPKKAGKKRKKR